MISLLKKILSDKYKRGVKERLGVPTLHWSLENLKRNKFYPSTVIDGGAYQGYWTLELLDVYPSAKVLMVEAQETKELILKNLTISKKNTDYTIALLSSQTGKNLKFAESETGSQVITDGRFGNEIPMKVSKTLDDLLKQKDFPYPDLLKLDVQGHELEVLKGAPNSLKHAEVCLLELSLMSLGSNMPLISEMISYMDSNNFQPYDISQFVRRPFDKGLAQIDMFFVKKDSDLVASTRWA